jgi:hypothetical protein
MAPKKETTTKAAPEASKPVIIDLVPEVEPVDETASHELVGGEWSPDGASNEAPIVPPEPDPECEVTPEVVEEGAIEPEDFNADEPIEEIPGPIHEFTWRGEHVVAHVAEQGYIDVTHDDGNEEYVLAADFEDAKPFVVPEP